MQLNYLTNPERVVFPDNGYTKLQVAEYYERIMPWFLSQIAYRPLSLVRCPEGMTGACFLQTHYTPQIGTHVRALRGAENDGEKIDLIYIEDAEGVRELVQRNTVEFHAWGATVDRLEFANLLTFDLDPGPNVAWKEVVDAAELLRHVLQGLNLQTFVKLSGGKGLHLSVPLAPPQPWEIARQFCRQVAATLARARPAAFVDVPALAQRTGRIFIDYMRNARGATNVAAYSLRTRPGAPVSMPITWSELHDVKHAAAYTLRNATSYLKKLKRDPWRSLREVSQTV